MSTARAIVPEDLLVLRLRATDQILDAEVLEAGARTRLRIQGPVGPLRPESFDEGVDVEFFEGSARFNSLDVQVLGFDRPEAEIHLAGPIHLEAVRRRATFRERLELEVLIAPYDDGPPFLRGGLGPMAVEGITIDVGGGGISVECRRPIEVEAGELVRVEVDVDGFSVRALAKVAWINVKASGRSVAGLGFTEVEERGHDRLYRHLYALQRQFGRR